MKTRALITAGVLALTLSTSVQALEIQKPNLGAVKSMAASAIPPATAQEKAAFKQQITKINSKLLKANMSLQVSFNSLVSALESKENAAKIKKQLQEINLNKNLSESEKSAKVAKVMTDYSTALQENKDELGKAIASANDAKKQEIINAINALGNTLTIYLDVLLDTTEAITTLASCPGLTLSLSEEASAIKTTGVVLKENVKSMKDVLKQAVQVAKIGGIKIEMPKDTSKKAKKTSIPL